MKDILSKINITDVKEIPNEFPAYSFFYTSDNLKVKGFFIFPKDTNKNCPVVFMNRGGTGDYGIITEETIGQYSFFAKAGYITVMSQYRGSDGGEGSDKMGGDDVFDVINLYSIIELIPFADLNRIGMWGVSRGGMMAFQVISRVPWVKACVAVSTITDEIHAAVWRKDWRNHQIKTYGGSYIEQYKRSPLLWTHLIPQIPIMFFVGMKDDRVDPAKIVEMAEKIKAKITIFPDDGHLITRKTVDESVNFFNATL